MAPLRLAATLLLVLLPALAAASFVGHTTETPKGKKIRVLCIGDSITEGVVLNTLQERQPYCKFLLAKAQAANVANFKVVEEGVSGELVVPTMAERTMMALGAAEAAGQEYTHVLIEGGFNDINFGRKAEDIFGGLLHMYRDSGKSGAHVVAMTLYEYNISSPALAPMEEVRGGLNVLIRDHILSYGEAGKLSLVDLDKLITRESKPKSGNSTSLYSDALHLTGEGYQVMAGFVWDQVFAPLVGSTQ